MNREDIIKHYCNNKCHKQECKLKSPCKEVVWYADGYEDGSNLLTKDKDNGKQEETKED